MVDDVNLDSFLTDSKEESSSFVNDITQNMPRPKLKKIKRPKIRPHPDIPEAPAKIAIDSEIDFSEQVDKEAVSQPKAHDDTSAVAGTDLVTAADAQNLIDEANMQTPYVLGGFPPDLDFNGDAPAEFDDGSYVKKNIVYSVATACLVIGIVLGFLIAPKGTEQHGLEDVAWNADTPKGRVRCGKTDPAQACTFYVLNSFKRELSGRDFYKLAAQMTGREEFMIETENMQYATTKIKPGFFAQLNIPALR